MVDPTLITTYGFPTAATVVIWRLYLQTQKKYENLTNKFIDTIKELNEQNRKDREEDLKCYQNIAEQTKVLAEQIKSHVQTKYEFMELTKQTIDMIRNSDKTKDEIFQLLKEQIRENDLIRKNNNNK